MMEMKFNAGQQKRYGENDVTIKFRQLAYQPAETVDGIPPLQFHPQFQAYNYVVTIDHTEKIPDVTAGMVDWWWANMEKGYPLWAPGEHYGFYWEAAPCDYGYEGSVEAVYEFDARFPMFIKRLSMNRYPFTECMEHCWMSTAILGGIETFLIHMYEDVEGGIYWRTVEFMTESNAKKRADCPETTPPNLADHNAYEAGMLSAFLPKLYDLWRNHPDPWQNVQYDLTVIRKTDGTWKHKKNNLPPAAESVSICR